MNPTELVLDNPPYGSDQMIPTTLYEFSNANHVQQQQGNTPDNMYSTSSSSTSSSPVSVNHIASQQSQQSTAGNNNSSLVVPKTLSSRSLSRIAHRQLNDNIIKWLQQNYKFQDGICLPRCTLYTHYKDYMKRCEASIEPIGAAGFGKLVRKTFPSITTRRLGTRGQSKYHYYGIAIRETSIYYQLEQQKQQQHHHQHHDHHSAKLFNSGNADDLASYIQNSEFYANPGYYGPYMGQYSYQQYQNQNFPYVSNFATSLASSYSHFHANGHFPYTLNTIRSNGHHSNISASKKRTRKILLSRMQKANQSESANQLSDNSEFQDLTNQKPVYEATNATNNSESPIRSQSAVKTNLTTNQPFPVDCESMSPISVNSTYAYFQQHFPTAADFQTAPADISASTLSTFLLMYQSHSQRILDTFQLTNVEELERTITHFWTEMPPHLGQFMSHPFLLVLIECCDTLLYRTIEDSLSQLSLLPEMSGVFVSDVEIILKNMTTWLRCSILGEHSRMRSIICGSSESNGTNKAWYGNHDSKQQFEHAGEQQLYRLVSLKIHLFDQFAGAIQKLLNFFKIAKECRHRIMQPKYASQMTDDLSQIWLDEESSSAESTSPQGYHAITEENSPLRQQQDRLLFLGSAGSTTNSSSSCNPNTIANNSNNYCTALTTKIKPSSEQAIVECSKVGQSEVPDIELLAVFHRAFKSLLQALQKNMDFDQILRWARSLMEKCVISYKWSCLTSRSQTLLGAYTCYVLGVMRDMTINGAKSSDLWNLVFMCIKEFLLLETARHIRYEEQTIRRMDLLSPENKQQLVNPETNSTGRMAHDSLVKSAHKSPTNRSLKSTQFYHFDQQQQQQQTATEPNNAILRTSITDAVTGVEYSSSNTNVWTSQANAFNQQLQPSAEQTNNFYEQFNNNNNNQNRYEPSSQEDYSRKFSASSTGSGRFSSVEENVRDYVNNPSSGPVDYQSNDYFEAASLNQCFGQSVPLASSKHPPASNYYESISSTSSTCSFDDTEMVPTESYSSHQTESLLVEYHHPQSIQVDCLQTTFHHYPQSNPQQQQQQAESQSSSCSNEHLYINSSSSRTFLSGPNNLVTYANGNVYTCLT